MESNFPYSVGFKCRDTVSQSVMQRKLKKRKEEAKSISQRCEKHIHKQQDLKD